VSRFGTACVVPFQAAKIRHTSSSHRACRTVRHVQCAASREHASRPSATERPDLPSRRSVLLSSAVVIGTLTTTLPATALGFQKQMKKRKLTDADYSEGPNGFLISELSEGSGTPVATGDSVTVHYDCMFRGLDVVSSRSARLLGANRTLAEPLTFTAGKKVSVGDKTAGETAGGLFSGQSGPKPPPALSTAVLGMKKGGKRSVKVPADQAYGHAGIMEIPPDTDIELRIEVLSVN